MRALVERTRDRPRGDRPARRWRPECEPLEGRDLTVVTSVTGTAVPQFLLPARGQTVNVLVSGTIANTLRKRPEVSFQVVDEYRRIATSGPVPLTLISARPRAFTYSYTVRVPLVAQVSSADTSGRSYYILISAGDTQNGQGTYVPVLVPSGPVPAAGRARVRA